MGFGTNTNEDKELSFMQNAKLGTIYMNDFGDGKFFNIVIEDQDVMNIELTSRTKLEIKYIKKNESIKGLKIVKIIDNVKKEEVNISTFVLSQLKAFIELISKLDLKGFSERHIKLSDDSLLDFDEGTKIILKEFISNTDGIKIIEEILSNGAISSKDIVNTGYRKNQLAIFEKMLSQSDYWKSFADDNEINKYSEEKVWQHYFQQNPWIFGYGLDYRYQQILQREAQLSNTELDGSGSVVTDYLIGDPRFTTFVELKKPSTKLFGTNKNRSNSWCLSDDLFYAVSQILEQKASGQIKLESGLYDSDGNKIDQKAYDSKVILIIGHWNELNDSSNEKEKEMKKKTLELFRRDSRNIEILTYDELFARAKFIVEGKG